MIDFSVVESVDLSQFPESRLLCERLRFVLIIKSDAQKLILFKRRKTGAQIIEEHWVENSTYKASFRVPDTSSNGHFLNQTFPQSDISPIEELSIIGKYSDWGSVHLRKCLALLLFK